MKRLGDISTSGLVTLISPEKVYDFESEMYMPGLNIQKLEVVSLLGHIPFGHAKVIGTYAALYQEEQIADTIDVDIAQQQELVNVHYMLESEIDINRVVTFPNLPDAFVTDLGIELKDMDYLNTLRFVQDHLPVTIYYSETIQDIEDIAKWYVTDVYTDPRDVHKQRISSRKRDLAERILIPRYNLF